MNKNLNPILNELLHYFKQDYRGGTIPKENHNDKVAPKIPSSFGFFSRTKEELKVYKETPKPVFSLRDLMPRDWTVFERDDVKIKRILEIVRSNVLRYKFWLARLKEIFVCGERDVLSDSEKLKRGDFKVYIRLSHNEFNRYNLGLLSSGQARGMIDTFLGFGILSRVAEKEWDSYHFDTEQPELSYAIGYELNLKRLFAWMRGVRDLIIEEVWSRFHVNLLLEELEDNCFRKYSKVGCVERLKKLDDFYCKNLGEEWIVLATTRKDCDKELDFRYIRRVLKMTIQEIGVFESFCYERADVILDLADKNGIEFSKGLRSYLMILSHIIKLLKVFNADKGQGKYRINPHRLKVKRYIRCSGRIGRYLGSISFRIANDLCSVPKKEPIYKGELYLNRDEIFKEMFGCSKVYQYDTANSVHADNVYMRTGKRLKGDLYTDIIPPLFKERLLNDKEWVESVGRSWQVKESWKGKETAERVFEWLTDRADTKKKCNVLYAVRGSGGKLYNFLFQRFLDDSGKTDENFKNGVKVYCKHFGDVYKEIIGKTLGSHIYAVESFRMLWVACEILKRGQKAGLVYDCLVTDGELKAVEFDELNNAALDELKIIGKDFYDLWEGLK